MRKLILSIAIVGFMFALPNAPIADADNGKQDICHMTGQANDVLFGFIYFGNTINVNDKAVPAHLTHGDSDDAWAPPAKLLDLVEHFGVRLANADCVFFSK